jgi:hypothetical protein
MVYDFSRDDPALYDANSGVIRSGSRYWLPLFKKGVGWLDTNNCLHRLDGSIVCEVGKEPAVLLPNEDITKIEYVDDIEVFGIAKLKPQAFPQKTPPTPTPPALQPAPLPPSQPALQQTLPTEAVLSTLRSNQQAEAEVESVSAYQLQITNLTVGTNVSVVVKQSTKRNLLIILNAGVARIWLHVQPNFAVGTGIPVQPAGGQLKLTLSGGIDICRAQWFGIAEASTNIVVIEATSVE